MKKHSLFLIFGLSIILVGCGKKDKTDPNVVLQDKNVTVMSEKDIKFEGNLTDDDYKELGLERLDLNKDYYSDYKPLSKEEYAELMKAPKASDNTLDTSKFTEEQRKLYERMYATGLDFQFDVDKVLNDVKNFFGEKNRSKINTMIYSETADLRIGDIYENSDEFVAVCYTGNISTDFEDYAINGDISYRNKDGRAVTNLDGVYRTTDDYDYIYLFNLYETNVAQLEIGVYSHRNDLFTDLTYLFENITNPKISNIYDNLYTVEFDVDDSIIANTYLCNKLYISDIFKDYKDTTITGQVVVNYNSSTINSVVLTQTADNIELRMTYNFEKYNTKLKFALFDDTELLTIYAYQYKNNYVTNPATGELEITDVEIDYKKLTELYRLYQSRRDSKDNIKKKNKNTDLNKEIKNMIKDEKKNNKTTENTKDTSNTETGNTGDIINSIQNQDGTDKHK